MEEYFAAGGRLSVVLPGFEARGEQLDLARAIASAIEDGEHLVAEAGTGTGKSLAYLIPALASGRRVVVATATKALQDQLLRKDVPAAAAALGREVDCVLLKGRENYLCRRSLDGLALLGGAAGALFRTSADAGQYEELRDWIETTRTGDRAELPLEPSPSLWAELSVGGDRCLGWKCPSRGTCFSEQARSRAGEAELVITNHALYLADVALRARSANPDSGVLPEHDAVVFDECHRLEDAASSWFGGRVSAVALRRLSRDVERLARDRGEAAPDALLARIEQRGVGLVESLAPGRGRSRLTTEAADGLVDEVTDAAATLARLAGHLGGRSDEADLLARRALAVASDLERAFELDPRDVAWAEPGAVSWAPVEVADILRELIWEAGVTAVLLSATLRVPSAADEDGLGFERARLGLTGARELVVDSPFDYPAQALTYVPAGMPDQGAPDYHDRLADEVVELCRLSRGRALVLTTSYRSLEELAERIPPRLPYPVLRQGEAPRERLLERFRDEIESVLVATATFWQGVDVPGESLSLLVIDKLPFAPPGDPLVQARCERIESEGGDAFAAYSLPMAILALRQGFGRLIRSHADRGVVAILDPRLRTRSYGRAFLAGLPPCPVVSDLAEVAAFFGSEDAV